MLVDAKMFSGEERAVSLCFLENFQLTARISIAVVSLVIVGVIQLWPSAHNLHAASNVEIGIEGTHFTLDGESFEFCGVSFFNAIYNPAFNQNSNERKKWLGKFRQYGINVLRIWGQWDSPKGFVDSCPDCSLYESNGELRTDHFNTLKQIIRDAREEGIAIELTLFQHGSFSAGIVLEPPADQKAVESLTNELKPFRNVLFQIWNEHHDDRVLTLVNLIHALDADRLVTSSPGWGGRLGTRELNEALDFLTPHTSRQTQATTWVKAPLEIQHLLHAFKKPVVDDEPARNGTATYGGPTEVTYPCDHILHIWEVRKVGGYPIYHHDMFQTGYGTPTCPPHGIPDPEFSIYHRQVFEFLKHRERYFQQFVP